MRNQVDKKFTWVIKSYFSLCSSSDKIYSDIFVAGRCKWRLLLAFPIEKVIQLRYLSFSLYLCVADSESLPSGWRRHAKFSLTMVNQKCGEISQLRESENWFDQKNPTSSYLNMFPLKDLKSFNGFLVNGEVKIVAEVDVLEVIGKLDVPEETVGNIDVNGFQFQVPASQVESVNSLFKKYPGVASTVPKNPHLRQVYLNVALSVTETLSKSPEELSSGDLADAYSALKCVAKAGFKFDWLEKILKETGQTRLQEIKEEIKDLKLKCADMEALIEFLR